MLLTSSIPLILGKDPPPAAVKEFVCHCHQIAHVYLRRKVSGGRLNPDQFGISIEDLALDCIADLFQRDRNGSFTRLVGYYSFVDTSGISEEVLRAQTRRLVFSEVNQRLFRLYRESDPSLGKIIRNIKNAARYSDSFILERRSDDLWLCTPDTDPVTESRPTLSPEIAEIRLGVRLPANASLKNFLEALAEVLHEEDEYQPAFPLVGLALIVRSAFLRLQDDTAALSGDEYPFTGTDIQQMILSSIDSVKKRMHPSYVGTKKLDTSAYESHFLAIRDILVAQFMHDNGFDLSFFEHLHNHIKDLTPTDYQSRHRVYLEYLSKLTRRELLDALKKELR